MPYGTYVYDHTFRGFKSITSWLHAYLLSQASGTWSRCAHLLKGGPQPQDVSHLLEDTRGEDLVGEFR